jgi:uncharacterized membrane protein SirB2
MSWKIMNNAVDCLLIIAGAVLTYSSLFDYSNPKVKWNGRVIAFCLGISLVYFGVRLLMHSK